MAEAAFTASSVQPNVAQNPLNGLFAAFAVRAIAENKSNQLNALFQPFQPGRVVARTFVRKMPLNAIGLPDITIGATATLSGTVLDGGAPVPFCIVMLYRRQLGLFVARAMANASGAFTFTDLPTTNPLDYFAVAFDPAGGVVQNALIFDYLSPA